MGAASAMIFSGKWLSSLRSLVFEGLEAREGEIVRERVLTAG